MSQDQLFAAFQAFMDAQNATGVEVEAKPTRKATRKTATKTATKTAKSPAKRTSTKRTSTKRTCNITAGEAWNALGADPEFEPKDHSKPASGPMLWRLNAQGELAALLA